MGDLVNLRHARKHKRRATEAAAAAGNRAEHGRTGAEKRRTELQRQIEERRIEAHRRGGDGEAEGKESTNS